MRKKVISWILTLGMIAGMFQGTAITAKATDNKSVGVDISGAVNVDVSGQISIANGGVYRLSGNGTASVTVPDNATVTLILDGVTINSNESPIQLGEGSTVTMVATDGSTNQLVCTASGAEAVMTAGICVPETATLTIDKVIGENGSGSIIAKGGYGGAGIGGSSNGYSEQRAGNGESGLAGTGCSGSLASATGGTAGQGGQGGRFGNNGQTSGTINIYNGVINAEGGQGAAGIGGGFGIDGEKGEDGVNGGNGGTYGNSGIINTHDVGGGAGGGGGGAGGNGGNGGSGGNATSVTISGGKITAIGKNGAAGIGGGAGGSGGDGGVAGTKGSAGAPGQFSIGNISQGGFSVRGGYGADGGSGQSGWGGIGGSGGSGGNIRISGGMVYAKGSIGAGAGKSGTSSQSVGGVGDTEPGTAGGPYSAGRHAWTVRNGNPGGKGGAASGQPTGDKTEGAAAKIAIVGSDNNIDFVDESENVSALERPIDKNAKKLYHVTMNVRDKEDTQDIEGADIAVKVGDYTYRTVSRTDGTATLWLPEGTYSLEKKDVYKNGVGGISGKRPVTLNVEANDQNTVTAYIGALSASLAPEDYPHATLDPEEAEENERYEGKITPYPNYQIDESKITVIMGDTKLDSGYTIRKQTDGTVDVTVDDVTADLVFDISKAMIRDMSEITVTGLEKQTKKRSADKVGTYVAIYPDEDHPQDTSRIHTVEEVDGKVTVPRNTEISLVFKPADATDMNTDVNVNENETFSILTGLTDITDNNKKVTKEDLSGTFDWAAKSYTYKVTPKAAKHELNAEFTRSHVVHIHVSGGDVNADSISKYVRKEVQPASQNHRVIVTDGETMDLRFTATEKDHKCETYTWGAFDDTTVTPKELKASESTTGQYELTTEKVTAPRYLNVTFEEGQQIGVEITLNGGTLVQDGQKWSKKTPAEPEKDKYDVYESVVPSTTKEFDVRVKTVAGHELVSFSIDQQKYAVEEALKLPDGRFTYDQTTKTYTYKITDFTKHHSLTFDFVGLNMVTFKAGEDVLDVKGVLPGKKLSKAVYDNMEQAAVTKAPDGYSFFVWKDDQGTVYNETKAINNPVTLHAEFRKNVGVDSDHNGDVIAADDFIIHITDVDPATGITETIAKDRSNVEAYKADASRASADEIRVKGTEKVNAVGEFELTYTMGKATVTAKVTVNNENPVVVGKTAYTLTFEGVEGQDNYQVTTEDGQEVPGARIWEKTVKTGTKAVKHGKYVIEGLEKGTTYRISHPYYGSTLGTTSLVDAKDIAERFAPEEETIHEPKGGYEEKAENSKAEVTVDEDTGNYVVKVKDNINHTVEIPDTWEDVTVDMNGNTIKGDNATDTDGAKPGIDFITDPGDRHPGSNITFIDTSKDGRGTIAGGDGSKEHPDGAAGIRGEENAENPEVTIKKPVKVIGGNGVTGEDGNGGNGGAGINGNVKPTINGGTVSGGNGGNGADTDKGDAGNGGSGGAGITTPDKDVTIIGGTVTGGNAGNGGNATGTGADKGTGGSGGTGGTGIDGGSGTITVDKDSTVTGGNGGNGGDSSKGNGGNGGTGGTGTETTDPGKTDNAGTITGGNGGNGGNTETGIGGNGGTGGTGTDGKTDNKDTGKIDGGNGGNGGDSDKGHGGSGGTGGTGTGSKEETDNKGNIGDGNRGNGGDSADVKNPVIIGRTAYTLTFRGVPSQDNYKVTTEDGNEVPGATIREFPEDSGKYVIEGLEKGTVYIISHPNYGSTKGRTLYVDAKDIAERFAPEEETTHEPPNGYGERGENSKAEVTVDQDTGNYVVKVKDDVDHTVEIPDTWEDVTVDMNGNTIKGDNATDTDGAKPGIDFIKDPGENHPGSNIIFVDKSKDGGGTIAGGDGSKEHPDGAAGIRGEENAKNPEVTIKKPVKVIGGNGVTGEDGNGGNGGAGINGNVKPTINGGTVSGGNGGNGADTDKGDAGNGGSGGAGITTPDKDVTIIGGTVTGGNAGNGGNATGTGTDKGNGGDAGNGGAGIDAGGGTITVDKDSTVTGGNGGQGGNAAEGTGGAGGAGGTGTETTEPGQTNNAGTITGGNAGNGGNSENGTGGDGGNAGSAITGKAENTGTTTDGSAGNGGTGDNGNDGNDGNHGGGGVGAGESTIKQVTTSIVKTVVKTGDSAQLWLLSVLLLISTGVVIRVYTRRKKHK